MRVYNRKEFLQLPTGTIFCKGVKWCFDNLSIKGDSWDNDFLYVDLCNIESNGTDQWVERLEDSLKNTTSYPINNDTSRDGCFDEDVIFLVYEENDLQILVKIIKSSIYKINNQE